MAKMTVLEIAQDILSAMGDDNVNSINDTARAYQVALIVQSTYNEIINSRDWPHLSTMMQLTSSGTVTRPTHMALPDNVRKIEFINYNTEATGATTPVYKEMTYLLPQEFLAILNARNEADSSITSYSDISGIELLIQTNKAPAYWTSFDDENIVFDSFDSTVDNTLQTSKTQVLALREATFTVSDSHTPDLPSKAFPYLLAEAKSTCFEQLKQQSSGKAEQQSRRHRTHLATEKWRAGGGLVMNNYGR